MRSLIDYLKLVEINPDYGGSGQHRSAIVLDPEIVSDRNCPRRVREMAGNFLGYVNEHSHRDSGTYWWFSNNENVRSDGPHCATQKLSRRKAERELLKRCLHSLRAMFKGNRRKKIVLDPEFAPSAFDMKFAGDVCDSIAEADANEFEYALAGYYAGMQHGLQKYIDLTRVPTWARYVCQCADGSFMFFSHEPKINVAYGKWEAAEGKSMKLVINDHWQNSVQKL